MAKKRSFSHLVVFAIIFFLSLTAGVFLLHRKHQDEQPSVTAEQLYQNCHNQTNSLCYPNAFYALTKHTSLQNSMHVLSLLQQKDTKTYDCHKIAHVISRAETEKNPINWQHVLHQVSALTCTGGYIMGVMETFHTLNAQFDLNDKNAVTICKTAQAQSGRLGEFNCLHTIGHLLFVNKNGDTTKALNLCHNMQVNDKLRFECYSGVFMERLTHQNQFHDFMAQQMTWTPQEITAQEQLCNTFSNYSQVACWRELATAYVAASHNPEATYTSCMNAPTESAQRECYLLGVQELILTPDISSVSLAALCKPYVTSTISTNMCQSYAVGALLNSSNTTVKRVVAFCSTFTGLAVQRCYKYLGYQLIFTQQPESIRVSVCGQVPPQFQKDCLEGKLS